jgi:hypothetical protein
MASSSEIVVAGTAVTYATGMRIKKIKPPRPSWKLLGLAGVAGVAATGAVIARKRRAEREYDPDELRGRLHERLAGVERETGDG